MAESTSFSTTLTSKFTSNLLANIYTPSGAVSTGYATYVNVSNLITGTTAAGKWIQFGRNVEASLVSFATGATSFDSSGFVNASAGLVISSVFIATTTLNLTNALVGTFVSITVGSAAQALYDSIAQHYPELMTEIGPALQRQIDNLIKSDPVVTASPNGNTTVSFAGTSYLEYTFDAAGNIVRQTAIDPDGRRSVTDYTYDSNGNASRKTEATTNGDGTQATQVTDLTYDAQGNVSRETTSITKADGSQASSITDWTFDPAGNVTRTTTTVVGPDGSQTSILVDLTLGADGEVVRRTTTTTDNAGNQKTTMIDLTYDTDGNVVRRTTTATDANGNQTTTTIDLTYDADGNLVHRTTTNIDHAGNQTTTSVDWTYDTDGNVVHKLSLTTDASGNQSTTTVNWTYDANGNLVQKTTTTIDFSGNQTSTTINRTYDFEGKLTTETTTVLDAAGNASTTTIEWTYGSDGSVEQRITTRPDGSMVIDDYGDDGVTRTVTDPEGNIVKREFYAENPPAEDLGGGGGGGAGAGAGAGSPGGGGGASGGGSGGAGGGSQSGGGGGGAAGGSGSGGSGSPWPPIPTITWLPPPGEDDPFSNPPVSPLALDLDGDGLDLVDIGSSRAYFDLDANGFAEHTAWIGSDDGFLVRDVNANGRIDDRTELFGGANPSAAQSSNGFTALSALDSNGDGRVDAADADFDKLLIWRDADEDGFSDAGELQSLPSVGVTGIDLAASYVNDWVGSNWVSHESTYSTATGSGTVADVWFETNTMLSVYRYGLRYIEYDSDVKLLPDLKGYGVLPDLRAAMQERADLRAAVSDLISQAGTLTQPQFLAAISAVLHKWAGVEAINPASRGEFVDARHLAFAEKLYGRQWVDWTSANSNPGQIAGRQLEDLYQRMVTSLTAKFLVQVPSAALLQKWAAGIFDQSETANLPYGMLSELSYIKSEDRIYGTIESIVQRAFSEVASGSGGRGGSLVKFFDAMNLVSLFELDLASSREQLADKVRAELVRLDAGTQLLLAADAALQDRPLIVGTEQADNMVLSGASDSDDVIVGIGGDDVLNGGFGDDTYVWARGDGNDTITEATNSGDADTLVLDGVSPSDVTLTRSGNILSIVVADSASGAADGGTITLNAQIDEYFSQGVERIQFADGTIWTRNDVRLMLLAAAQTSGNDNIVGYNTADTLSGGAGDDLLQGKGGDDTYVYARGDGFDTVVEETNMGSADRLILQGIGQSSVTLTRSGNDVTLVIAESSPGAGDGGSVLLKDQFNSYFGRGIEQVVFGDGSIWTANDIRLMLASTAGTAGNDVITGSTADDVIAGRGGNDTINGKAGSDTYIYSRGDGADTITEEANFGVVDALVLRGVTPSAVSLVRSGLDLTLVIAETAPGAGDGGSILLKSQLDDYFSRGIEQVTFDDGSLWTANDLRLRVLTEASTSGADTITGFNTADAIRGSAGDDTINGKAGNDTYYYARGDGIDTITEETNGGSADRLMLEGVSQTDVQLVRSGLDLTLVVADSSVGAGDGGSILLKSQLDDNFSRGIEQVVFGDGSVWTANDLRLRVLAEASTSGADTITGFNTNDVIDGGVGNDTINGASGHDRLIGGSGVDNLTGGAGNDTFVFRAGFGADVVADFKDTTFENDVIEFSTAEFATYANIVAASTQVGADVVITVSPSDTITIKNWTLSKMGADDFSIV